MKNPLPKSTQQKITEVRETSEVFWHWLTGKPDPALEKDCDFDVEKDLKKGTHFFLGCLVAICLLAFLWSLIGRLDISSQAMGEVYPSTQGKTIQHLEGGIVQELLVKEGEKVEAGQPLITLESTKSGSEVEQLQLQIAALSIDIARLKSELADFKPMIFENAMDKAYPTLAHEAEKLYDIRKKRYHAETNSLNQQVEQQRHELEAISIRIHNANEALTLTEEQVTISEELLKDDLTNRYNHIDLLREANRLKSQIGEDSATLLKLEATFEEKQANLNSKKHNFHEEISKDLEQSRRDLEDRIQELEKYADSLERTVITSPVNGTVKQMYVFTKGGVVQPGQTLLDIIPSGDQLIVDARLPVQDIGYIKLGQNAVIRLASNDGMRFDKLDGKVTFISPDTISSTPDSKQQNHEEKNAPYYKVRIVTNKDHFSNGGIKYKLYPGVQVSVNILTGTRSILSYVLDPFLNNLHEALREH